MVEQICQRLLSLSMLAKSMDFKDIFGEVNNVLTRFGLDPARCVGFMLDGCAANMKALMALTTHCRNAVGMRGMSHLFNNAGDQIESTQIDKFAGALQTVLSLSHNASEQWRAATGTSPPKAPSHRWASSFERNDKLVTDWQHAKDFIDKFSSSDETRSAKAAFCREELARLGQHGYHQEFWLQLEFALAVDLGVHLTRATYLLEGDGMLVSHLNAVSIVPLPSCLLPYPLILFSQRLLVLYIFVFYVDYDSMLKLHMICFLFCFLNDRASFPCTVYVVHDMYFFFMTAHTSPVSPLSFPRHLHQLPVAFDAIMRVRNGLALRRAGDGTFGRPHLPNVDALIRQYCVTDVSTVCLANN